MSEEEDEFVGGCSMHIYHEATFIAVRAVYEHCEYTRDLIVIRRVGERCEEVCGSSSTKSSQEACLPLRSFQPLERIVQMPA